MKTKIFQIHMLQNDYSSLKINVFSSLKLHIENRMISNFANEYVIQIKIILKHIVGCKLP